MTNPLNPLLPPLSPATVRARGRAGAASGVFVMPEATAPGTAEEAAETAPVTAANPLLLHELAIDGDARRDQEARKHGEDVLDLLRELQRALLRPGGETDLRRLAALLEQQPEAADPALAAVTRAVMLRARIEIARRRPTSPTRD